MASIGELTWQPDDTDGPETLFVAGLTPAMITAIGQAVASPDGQEFLTLPQVSPHRDGPFMEGLFRASRLLSFRVLS